MHNFFIVNPEVLENTFADLTINSSEQVKRWFCVTLTKYWYARWAEHGPHVTIGTTKLVVPRAIKDPKDRRVYADIWSRIQRPPQLSHVEINTQRGVAFKDLTPDAIKALTNGATLSAFASIKLESLFKIRDFLDNFVKENPRKDLAKLQPLDLPSMLVAWDREQRKIREQAETAQSVAVLYKAKNGFSVCALGSALASSHVGTVLRNCLKGNTRYFERATLLCVKDNKDKIVAAIEIAIKKRVSCVRLNTKAPEDQNPLPVDALTVVQFYGAENESPPALAVDAFNEYCVSEDIRHHKDVNKHAFTNPKLWSEDGDDDAEGDDEETAEDDEDEDEELA